MATSSNALLKPGPLILAVDDDPSILRVIELLLARNGYSVKTAPNGEEALTLLRSIVPAILITDVAMPGMSGYDLCQVVKRDERLQNVPVVFLTAQGSPQDFRTGHDSGGVVYMVKPFKPEKLLQVVRMIAPPPESTTR
jgi:two-component system sensor histidine kinase ChiS